MNFFNYPYLGREHLKGLNEYKVRLEEKKTNFIEFHLINLV